MSLTPHEADQDAPLIFAVILILIDFEIWVKV
jgi:hypothetical protein